MLSKELKAMHKVQQVLKDFDNETRQRILTYTSKMYWDEEHKKQVGGKLAFLKGQSLGPQYRNERFSTIGLEQHPGLGFPENGPVPGFPENGPVPSGANETL